MLKSASGFKLSVKKCLCQRQVTSFTSMKNWSFGARGGNLKVTLFKRNTTQDFLCARGRYLLPTSMDKQSFGARGRYFNLASKGTWDTCFWLQTSRLFLRCLFSKRYNLISKCRSDTWFYQTQDVICLNDQTPISHFAQNLRYLLLAQGSSNAVMYWNVF